MEKIIIPVWKKGYSAEKFRQILLEDFSAELAAIDSVRSLKLCIVDEYVAAAAPYRMTNIFDPSFDAVVIVWVDAVTALKQYQKILDKYVSRHFAYLVTESNQLPYDSAGLPLGQKTEGMNEMVFIQKPERLEFDEWLEIWQGSHTKIAIDNQSTYGYRQNLVARKLSANAPDFACIVEENFPEKAIHGRMAFYDADDNEELYRAREQEMAESCIRFLDFDKIDCIPMSEYPMK